MRRAKKCSRVKTQLQRTAQCSPPNRVRIVSQIDLAVKSS